MKRIIYIIFLFSVYNNINAQSTAFSHEIDVYRFIHPMVKIWGISDDGKIAYTIDGQQLQEIEFVVYDMVEHRFLCDIQVSFPISVFPRSGVAYELNEEVRLMVENNYSRQLSDFIEKTGFKNFEFDIKFMNFPIVRGDAKYPVTRSVVYGRYQEIVDTYTIKIGEEEVAQIKPEYDSGHISLCGYFINANDNSVIIVVLETSYYSQDDQYRFIRVML
jgi:hypothetical protein